MVTEESGPRTIAEKRNRKMKISQAKLHNIIVEEYLKEEGYLDEALSPDRQAEVIAWIQGKAERPDWLTDDYALSGKSRTGQASMDRDVDRAADTMAFSGDMPQYDDAAIDDGGAYDPEAEAEVSEPHPVKAAVDGIYELVAEMDPEDVAEIFQIVFEKLPGVEMSAAEEPSPPSEYGGEEFDLRKKQDRQIGFKLEELKDLIREMLVENV